MTCLADADQLVILDAELLPALNTEEWCFVCDREIPAKEHSLDAMVGVLCSSCVRKAADRLDYLNTYGETN
jgi:hypothetical protein